VACSRLRPDGDQRHGLWIWFIGAQRETIMNDELAAALDLKSLADRPHLYGLGPIEQLRGEVTIVDSRPALARIAPDGAVNVTGGFDAGVPFFVWAEVPQWIRMPIPAAVRSFEDLERFLREQPRLTVSMRKSRCRFWCRLARVEATIVGFHSNRHRGVFTPGDGNIHIHFQTPDNSNSGHIQKLEIGDGATLCLPAA
jgi:acetolactate decarboxylase